MININDIVSRTLIYFPIFKIFVNNITFLEDKSISTACTNGSKIYYNSTFLASLSKDEQVFIIAHELMHITLKHLLRRNDRNMEVWNYATDAVINQILRKNGLPLITGVIDCPDAFSYSAEEYYEMVIQRPDCEELIKKYREEEHQKVFATHDRWGEGTDDEIIDDIPDIDEKKFDEVNKRIVHDENKDFRDFMEGSIDMPSITSTIEQVGESSPVIDWKTFLNIKKRKIISADYNLHRGEFNEEGIYAYPQEIIRSCEVEILIDTSGSVDDELVMAFLRECKNIFKDFPISIGCFDTKFYGFQRIKKLEDLETFQIEGRGGTNFNVAINAFNKKSAVKIIFTDGMALMPDKEMDVIWVVYSDYKINPKGGRVFNVDPKSLKMSGKKNK